MAGSAADQPLAPGFGRPHHDRRAHPARRYCRDPRSKTPTTIGKKANPPRPQLKCQLNRRAGKGENIRLSGENIRRGATVISAGTVIGPAELGMLAGIGNAEIPVLRKPRVVILSSGDELVDIYDDLDAGKIRDSNSYTLGWLGAARKQPAPAVAHRPGFARCHPQLVSAGAVVRSGSDPQQRRRLGGRG